MNTNQDQTILTSLDEMSEEQLRLLLAAEMDAETVNVALIKQVPAILASREEAKGNEIESSAADILQRAKNNGPALFPEVVEEMEQSHAGNGTRKPLRRTRLFKIVLVAAVITALLIGSSVAAGAAGLDLWGVISKWSADVFGYSKGETTFQGGHSGEAGYYNHLQTALMERGVELQVIPHYMPDGYKFLEGGTEESFEGKLVYGVLSNGENEIILNYMISNTANPNRFFAVDDSAPEVHTAAGIEHNIMTNENKYVISWTNGNVLCDISGVPSREDAIQMIDSIYEGGN